MSAEPIRIFAGFPLQLLARNGQHGYLQVQTWGPVCREDLEQLIGVLGISVRNWPTAEQMRERFRCPACDWSGEDDQRIAVFEKGRIGCPSCGSETSAIAQGPREAADA